VQLEKKKKKRKKQERKKETNDNSPRAYQCFYFYHPLT